jgi:3'-phosphoadenosine 5'-phosphosulfate sulfotransferase (PAPS reductase)/FAD synthetase
MPDCMTPALNLEALLAYDRIVVAFSGGKDSLACLLHLLELGVPRERLELWHHDVDGGPDAPRFMDWPVTTGYCRAVADALGVPLLLQWKEGGFKREMLRDDAPTAPTTLQLPDGTTKSVGGKGPNNTRRLFPQVTADLSKRWCSAYLKIDVAARAFANDPRFAQGRFLLVTGERREESAARSRYAELEEHRASSSRRHVDQWRAVIDWSEQDVWAIIQRHGVVPHPAYQLGFGRTSCMACIFGTDGQWAAVAELAPARFEEIASFETAFGKTIHRKDDVRTRAKRGLSIVRDADPRLKAASQLEKFEGPALVDPAAWALPAGAFRECAGPT